MKRSTLVKIVQWCGGFTVFGIFSAFGLLSAFGATIVYWVLIASQMDKWIDDIFKK